MPVELGPCSPFLIVADLAASLAFYTERLGFETRMRLPEEAPFFGIVGRDTAQILLKEVGESPLPNPQRHVDARWDIFVYCADPDALSREFAGRGVSFRLPHTDTEDGLRGFEVADPDGYVCFFGRPK